MKGRITKIAGSVVDVAFDGALPRIKEALTVEVSGVKRVMEVAHHIGNGETAGSANPPSTPSPWRRIAE